MKRCSPFLASLAIAAVLWGCGDSHEPTGPTDGGGLPVDGGGFRTDGGGLPTDGGGLPVDGGGLPIEDGGGAPVDGSMPTTPGGIGAACTMDGECTASMSTCYTRVGMGMYGYTFPGGYCSRMCTPGSGMSECGAGADCFGSGFGMFSFGFCAKTCSTAADCRMGYDCMAPPFGGGTTLYCVPPFGAGGDGGRFRFDGGFPFDGF